jgi:hypothetical protein
MKKAFTVNKFLHNKIHTKRMAAERYLAKAYSQVSKDMIG